MGDDRRLLGRITPRVTLAGRVGHTPVRIVDLSLRGSRVAHTDALPLGTTGLLSFRWEEGTIEASCEIVRSRYAPTRSGLPQFLTGLRIIEAAHGSAALLRQLICWHVTRALNEQIADARGLPPPPECSVEPPEEVYIRCELFRGMWRKVTTHSPAQPAVGFTIRVTESPASVDCLLNTYVFSDRDTRQLIQRMAAASLECEPAPLRLYHP